MSEFFFQFTFDPLWMTQTHEIITCKVSNKLMNGYGEMCMSGGKFLKEWQVTNKIIEGIFFQFTFHLFSHDSNSKKYNSYVFKNSWMHTRECLWVGESFLRNDKWQIKILSEFFSNSDSTFYKWLKLKK